MSKKYKQFFHGKGIPKNKTESKPTEGAANTNLDTYNAKTGFFRSRRKFGSDGKAYLDMDVADSAHPFDHVHEFVNGKHRKGQHLNKKQKREIRKAKKKRRFF